MCITVNLVPTKRQKKKKLSTFFYAQSCWAVFLSPNMQLSSCFWRLGILSCETWQPFPQADMSYPKLQNKENPHTCGTFFFFLLHPAIHIPCLKHSDLYYVFCPNNVFIFGYIPNILRRISAQNGRNSTFMY